MNKVMVTFWKGERDNYGMPATFHRYVVWVAPWSPTGSVAQEGSVVASIQEISSGAPVSQRHFYVEKGGEHAARDLAIEALRNEPSNRGLQELVQEG